MPVYNYVTDTGVIVVDAAFIEQQVIEEYQALFGSELVVTANTPQGMLIQAEVQARIAVAENNAKLANQINPNYAGGIFLDDIMALTNPYGRTAASPSVTFASIEGTPGTVIPIGSVVAETGTGDNNQFVTVELETIPDSGIIPAVQFNSLVDGPIPAPEGTLTNIITPILGWDSVTNSASPILGNLTQSDLQARIYRLNTLATQGASVAQAIISGVTLVPGVKSMSFLENTDSTTQTVSGVSMVRNSIYACVDCDTTGTGTYSTVIGTLTGTPATSVPAGTQVSSNGNVFATVNTVVIPASGVIDVLFQSVSTGAIACPAATLTTIVTPVVGLSSVTNAFDTSNVQTVVIGTITGTPTTVVPAGSQAQSGAFVYETLASVTIPAGGSIQTTFQCVTAGVISCPAGTLNVIVTPVAGWASVDNANDGTGTGTVSTVAQALVSKKSAGAAYNNGPGNAISAQVIVPYSNQVMTVLFDTPAAVPVNVIVNVSFVNSVQNVVQIVTNAILDYVNGLIPGIAGLVVGQNVSSFELAGAVTRLNPNIYVQSLFIATAPTTPTSSAEIPIAVYQIATIAASNITVNVLSS